ncbi:AAA family ATPase [Serratia sp. CY52157]|uniref:AAA family ATPase n=1 Tax=Serratia sp. CY52157 TaxID=3383633 RepID=UPI003FA156E4
MRLRQVRLSNFRGYKDEAMIDIDDALTGVIGKNDAGKSTILEALEIFFNNQQIKIDSTDRNVFSQDGTASISCIFDDLPNEVVLDSTSKTTLQQELLLNEDGFLEVKKSFDLTKKTPSEKITILANHPTNNGLSDLHSLKQSDLKKRLQEKGIDIKAVPDQRSNVEIRKTLYANEKLVLARTEVAVNKEDAKAIWEALSKYLPVYALFRSDRGSNDQDSEVQDPMKLAIINALKEVEGRLDEIKEHVRLRALDVAKRTLEKLEEMDSSLAKDLNPDFTKEPDWKSLFKLSLASDSGISVNKRGSGVRRLILLNFFRAEAEKHYASENTSNVIYAIEEPETAQHPGNQQMLIKALYKLSLRDRCQVILTTHVPALAGLLPLSGIRFIEKGEDNSVTINKGDDATYEKVASTLGILPNKEVYGANAFVMVEGYADVIFLNSLSDKLKAAGYLTHSLQDKNITPLISGGCGNLKHWVNLNIIKSLNRPWAVFLDSDDLGDGSSPEFLKKLPEIDGYREGGVFCHLTRKRECENYLHPNAIFRAKEVHVNVTDFDDMKVIINQHTQIRKVQVLEKLWPHMTAEEILERDQYQHSDGSRRNELLEVCKQLIELV